MDIIRPQNPIFVIVGLFVPWRFINTSIILEDDRITFHRYYAINQKQFRKKTDKIMIGDILQIGFPSDLNIRRQESDQCGEYGIYSSTEIVFITEFETIALNVKPYTKKQIRYLIEFIDSKNKNVLIGQKLTKAVNYNYAK